MAKGTEETVVENLKREFFNYVYNIVLTEKFSTMIEFENKLVFNVRKDSNKAILKLLIENYFGEKVKKVNTYNDHKGKKKAIVTFAKEGVASEIASKMGVM